MLCRQQTKPNDSSWGKRGTMCVYTVVVEWLDFLRTHSSDSLSNTTQHDAVVTKSRNM